jgi:hypothetical protein
LSVAYVSLNLADELAEQDEEDESATGRKPGGEDDEDHGSHASGRFIAAASINPVAGSWP